MTRIGSYFGVSATDVVSFSRAGDRAGLRHRGDGRAGMVRRADQSVMSTDAQDRRARPSGGAARDGLKAVPYDPYFGVSATDAVMSTDAQDRRARPSGRAARDGLSQGDARRQEKPAERDANAKELEIDFDVKNTGQTKALNGFQTREAARPA
jgi:hypothetical protein